MRGMVGAGDSAIGPHDLAAGNVSGDQRLVDRALDVARRGLDAHPQMIRGAGHTVTERLALAVRDERSRFRGASVDSKEVRHRCEFMRIRTVICTSQLTRRTLR